MFWSEIDFVPTIKVQYNSVLKLGEKYQKSQEFILVGNSQIIILQEYKIT